MQSKDDNVCMLMACRSQAKAMLWFAREGWLSSYGVSGWSVHAEAMCACRQYTHGEPIVCGQRGYVSKRVSGQ